MFSPDVIKAVYNMWETRFKMKKTHIDATIISDAKTINDDYYEYNGCILHMCHFGNMYCIESADSRELANQNFFDDAYTYDDGDYPISELLEGMEADIIESYGDVQDRID